MSSSMKAKTEKLPPAELPPGTTLDDFLGGRIAVAQPKAGHRAGSDAVWLQAAVSAQPGDRVLDAGSGVGVPGVGGAMSVFRRYQLPAAPGEETPPLNRK